MTETRRKWATGKECARCRIVWRVVHVEYRLRAIGAKPFRLYLCADVCLKRTQSMSECHGRKHGAYEYVKEIV